MQIFSISFLYKETKNDGDFLKYIIFGKQLQGQKYNKLSKSANLEIYIMQLGGDHL